MIGRILGPCLIAAFLFGCSTHYSWKASLPLLSGAVGDRCMRSVLSAEKDVFDVVQTGAEQFSFQLSLPDTKREDAASFSLHRTRDRDGNPALTLSTSYSESPFHNSRAQRLRARELITTIMEECTGQRPSLSGAQPCGAGETHDLCLEGSYDVGPSRP